MTQRPTSAPALPSALARLFALKAGDIGQHVGTLEIIAAHALEYLVGPFGVDGHKVAILDKPMHGGPADLQQFGYFSGGNQFLLLFLGHVIPLSLYTDIRILPQVSALSNNTLDIAYNIGTMVQWDIEQRNRQEQQPCSI
jgi:hypothetical protein